MIAAVPVDVVESTPVPVSEPARIFARQPTPAAPAESGPRFYMGGNIYESWASVPERYKGFVSGVPNPDRSTGTIFRFVF